MNRNYEIVDGIYLVQENYELDLHNNFEFKSLDYSVEERMLSLKWTCSKGSWVSRDTPKVVTIEFNEVSELRFMPRDTDMPFTKDNCISSFGY